MLVFRDLFVFKEGKKMSDLNTVTVVGFLYKVLKAQVKAKTKFDDKTLYLLIECLYLGYHNKSEQYINIFSMQTSTKFVNLISKLGIKYVLHFYCLASMENLNQKMYDFTKYHIMLLNKQAKNLPVYYTKSEVSKINLILKPLTSIIFRLEDDQPELMMPFLSVFIVLKAKINDDSLIEAPLNFIATINKELLRLNECLQEENQQLDGQILNQIWLYTKVLATSAQVEESVDEGISNLYDSLLNKLEIELTAYKDKQKNKCMHEYGISSPEILSNVLTFIPNMNNTFKLMMIVKANLLRIKFMDQIKVREQSIFSYSVDPSEQYFNTILQSIRQQPNKMQLLSDYPEYFEVLLKLVLTTRYAVRAKVLEIFKEILFESLEKEKYNFNPIHLICQIGSTGVNLETERSKINDIQKLQNIFLRGDLSLQMQRIYLRFLISMFWVKFTPLYTTVQKALGELLQSYHDSLIEEFERLIDSFDAILAIGPNDSLVSKTLYPKLKDREYTKLRSYAQVELTDDSESLEHRFMPTIKVYENIIKSFGFAIQNIEDDTQHRLTDRFNKFMEHEFLVYHKEFSKIRGTQVEV